MTCLLWAAVFIQVVLAEAHLNTHTACSELHKMTSNHTEVILRATSGQYWSKRAEELLQKIQPDGEERNILKGLRFITVRQGCGLLKNRLLETDNGQMFCARYRDNDDFVQGEYFAYLISKLLGLTNVPAAIPVEIDPWSPRWSSVWSDLLAAQWRPHGVVILTKWIPSLRPVTSPTYLHKAEGSCLDRKHMKNSDVAKEITFLLQWSDLVLFDYVTGNLDRIVSHLHCLQWDSDSMMRPVHNLMQNENGFLWFIDNEAAFQHSYRLMSHYQHLHQKLLDATCILRQQTINKIRKLAKSISLAKELQTLNEHHLMIASLPPTALDTLRHRLMDVIQHITGY